ncbi:hypothetical protein [Bacillus sp. FJAT-52991]|uniref:Uncharacterized protein n=1 Tax=Bacillus kandeliae TaxID=3129297 RepID=A0ABZ2N2E3_9BACI
MSFFKSNKKEQFDIEKLQSDGGKTTFFIGFSLILLGLIDSVKPVPNQFVIGATLSGFCFVLSDFILVGETSVKKSDAIAHYICQMLGVLFLFLLPAFLTMYPFGIDILKKYSDAFTLVALGVSFIIMSYKAIQYQNRKMKNQEDLTLRMNKVRLEQIKINSKTSFEYMKTIEKEYLLGDTLKDKIEFTHKFKSGHTIDEVNYLYNEMSGYKEGGVFFTNNYLSLYIPLFTIIFTVINVLLGALLNWSNSTTLKLIEEELKKEKPRFDNIIDGYNSVFSEVVDALLIGIAIILIFFSFFLYYRNKKQSQQIKYVSFLQSVQTLYNKDCNDVN